MAARTKFGRVVGVLVAASLACAVTATAYAATAFGPVTEMGTINGRNYQNVAFIDYHHGYVHAQGGAFVNTKGGVQAPANHMGAQASLWTSTGYLCVDTAWSYNSSADTSWYNLTWPNGCGSGYFYGDGQVRVWRPSLTAYLTAYPINTGVVYHY